MCLGSAKRIGIGIELFGNENGRNRRSEAEKSSFVQFDWSLFDIICLFIPNSPVPLHASFLLPFLLSPLSPLTLSCSTVGSDRRWEMLQETCRSGSISAGFRFLQYYIHFGRLYWIGSTRSLFLLMISPLLDVILNAEFFMLVIGLCSILTTDPGYVTNESSHHNQLVESPVSVFEAHSEELVPSARDIPYEFVAEENSIPLQRVRYCRHCDAYVKGFDHHCPAFGNCIGQKNHVLFIILLVGFVFTEASYVVCSSEFATKFQIMDNIGGLTSSSRNLQLAQCYSLFSKCSGRGYSCHGIFIVFVSTSKLMNG